MKNKYNKKNKINLEMVQDKMHNLLEGYKKTTFYNHYRQMMDKASPYLDPLTAHLNKSSMYYILGLIVLIYSLLTQTPFQILQPNNFVGTLLQNNSFIFLIAMPMFMVIVSGNIDLSVGRFLGFSGTLGILLYNNLVTTTSASGVSALVATLILILLFGAAFGAAEGFLVGYVKIPAFIVTLGTMLLFQGLSLYVLTTGRGSTATNVGIIGGLDSAYAQFGQASLPDLRINNEFWIGAFLFFTLVGFLAVAFAFYNRISTQKYGLKTSSVYSFIIKQVLVFTSLLAFGLLFGYSRQGLRTFVIYIFIGIGIMFFVMKNTKFGRGVYAIGGNQKTAELSGINPRFYKTLIFMIMGIYVSFAGMVNSSIFLNAQVNDGAGQELSVISAVFVGGASVTGGIGTIAGTIVGVLVITIIQNGSVLLNLGQDITNITTGVVLVAAVAYDVISHRKQ